MKEIKLTKGKVALVDDDDYAYLSQFKWHTAVVGYAARRGRKKEDGHHKIIYMHKEILPCEKGQEVDHINRNKLDNRKLNLRVVSHRVNCLNSDTTWGTSSNYRGVGWDNSRGKWRAQIGSLGKNCFIGRFDKEEDAARAYDNRAKIEHGEHAQLNFKEKE